MDHIVLIMNIVFILVLLGGVTMTVMGLPGNILIILAGFAYGYYEHFETIDYAILVIIFGIFIVSEIIEFVAGLIGAKKVKASKRAMLAPFIGTILGGVWGTAIFPIIGSLLGALLGAYIITALAEYSKTKDISQAKRVAKSVIKGQIFGVLIKAAAAVSMAILLVCQLKWQ
jgi:uncharacterized protein YqgC (DUF456 family)